MLGAATSILAFAQLDVAELFALVKTVTEDTQVVAERYLDGGKLTFPMSAHIGLGIHVVAARNKWNKMSFFRSPADSERLNPSRPSCSGQALRGGSEGQDRKAHCQS